MAGHVLLEISSACVDTTDNILLKVDWKCDIFTKIDAAIIVKRCHDDLWKKITENLLKLCLKNSWYAQAPSKRSSIYQVQSEPDTSFSFCQLSLKISSCSFAALEKKHSQLHRCRQFSAIHLGNSNNSNVHIHYSASSLYPMCRVLMASLHPCLHPCQWNQQTCCASWIYNNRCQMCYKGSPINREWCL